MKDKPIFDVWKNQFVGALPQDSPIKLGRFFIYPTKTEGPVYLNKIQLSPGGYCPVIPDKHQNISIVFDETTIVARCDSPLLFQPGLGENVLDIAEKLNEAKSLEEMTQIIPMIQDLSDKIELTEFEKLLLKHLPHIESVVVSPASKLTRVQEKLPVSRVKRYRNRAIDHLAQHSEDWMKRKYQSVLPRRLLAERIDETYDIYENQVTASLVDQTLRYLNYRIDEELSRLIDFLKVINELLEAQSNEGTSTWYPKVHRNLETIGQLFKDSLLEGKAESSNDTRALLIACRRRLLALRNTQFFSKVSNKGIGKNLKRTNRFENHKHYKYIAMLWEKWTAQQAVENDLEVQKGFEARVNGFKDYVQVILLRGLSLLNFLPVPETGLDPQNNPWEFKHNLFENLRVYWNNPIHSFEVSSSGVSISFQLVADEISIEESHSLKRQIPPKDEVRYLVYLFQPVKARSGTEIPLTLSPSSGLNFLPVSLEDPDGEERFARAIWFHLCKAHLNRFPIKVPNNLRNQLRKVTSESPGLLHEIISTDEEPWFRSKLESNDIGAIKRASKSLLEKQMLRGNQQKEAERVWDRFVADLTYLNDIVDRRLICISCGSKDKTTSQYISKDSFEVHCSRCKIEFGRKGNELFLILKTKAKENKLDYARMSLFDLDLLLGKDIWDNSAKSIKASFGIDA